MQPCIRIYYSTVHWRLNMFRAAYRSSELRLDYGRSPYAYVNQRLQIQFELLMMSGVLLETCWAFNERWNNKFCYKVASCWLFLLNHTTMHGSMNIKFKNTHTWLQIYSSIYCTHFPAILKFENGPLESKIQNSINHLTMGNSEK